MPASFNIIMKKNLRCLSNCFLMLSFEVANQLLFFSMVEILPKQRLPIWKLPHHDSYTSLKINMKINIRTDQNKKINQQQYCF